MKKALVTGGAGFIGSNVVRELLQEGIEVRVLVCPGESRRNLEGLEVECREGDVLDPEALRRATKGCDTIFHLAALYKLWLPDPRPLYEVNVRGSNHLLMVAREADVERIVFTSSVSTIGLDKDKKPALEQAPFNWFGINFHYVHTKYLSEIQALDMARFGLPVVVVNPSLPLGPGDITPTPSGQLIVDVVNGDFPGYIDAGVNVVDVRDVARGHVLAARKGRIGEKYILSNRNIPLKDLARAVAGVAGVRTRARRLPKPVMFGYAWVAEKIAAYITHQEPALTYAAAQVSAEYCYYDNTKARQELGLTLRPFEETLQDTVAWFREIGLIRR